MKSTFSNKVYSKLQQVPFGFIITYSELAKAIGCPNGSRAVGNVLNKNQNIPLIPCHRVVRIDKSVGGYALGLQKKIALLESEGIIIRECKIINFHERSWCFK